MRVTSPSGKVLKSLRYVSLSLLAALTASLTGQTTSPTPLDGFDPNANSIVTQTVVQSDGKILIAGYFTSLTPNGASGSTNAPYVARLNTDGSVDSTFSGFTGTDNTVTCLQLLSNGQILISGFFSKVDGTAQAGVARLNKDGSLDTTFAPTFVGPYNSTSIQVYQAAAQANGQVVVVGSFVQVDGVKRNKVARLNANGTLDTTFDPEANQTVTAVAIQSNQQIIIGGAFTTLNPVVSGTAVYSSAQTYNHIARLTTDGHIDESFNPDINGNLTTSSCQINTILVQANGQILVGGAFGDFQPNGASGSTQCDNFARLNSDGTLDGTYILNPNSTVNGIAIQPDGKLILCGGFSSVYPVNSTTSTSVNYVARINVDGTVDNSFHPTPNYNVNCAAVQSNGSIVIGGYFNSLTPNGAPGTTARNYIARVNPDGSLDATFAPDTVGRIVTSAVASDGTTYIGGTFTSINGSTANYFARLKSDGTLYTSWSTTPVFNGTVSDIVTLSDGSVIVAGNFTQVNSTARNYIAKLNSDGSLASWDPDANGPVYCLLPVSNNQLLIGGSFTTLTPNANGSTSATATTKSYIARLNSDATIDTTFNPTPDGQIYSMALQSDGSIILGGAFTTLYSTGDTFSNSRLYCARLDSTGRLDEKTFNPTPNAAVYTIAVQQDNKILLGGAFTALEPALLGSAAATETNYPTQRKYIARLNSDGSLDGPTYFNPKAGGYDPEASSTVLSIALATPSSATSDAIVGGNFTSFQPGASETSGVSTVLRNYLAWITSTGTIDTAITTQTNNQVGSVNVTSSGQVLIGGLFTTVTPNGGTAQSRSHFARLNSNGALDTTFQVGAVASGGGTINALAIQPTGSLLVAGSFATLGGAQSTNLARFNEAGYADLSFDPDPNGQVNAVAVPALGSATPINSAYAAWLTSSGNLKESFATNVNGEVTCFATQANGAFLVGGLFASFGGSTSPNLVRFKADGSVDTSFNPDIEGEVLSVGLTPVDSSGNQNIIIAGDFTSVAGLTVSYLAELDHTGAVVTTFNPAANAEVREVYVQPDNGYIVIGGSFTSLAPTTVGGSTGTSVTREDIARLKPDGTVDTGFNPNPNGAVYAITPIPNSSTAYGGGYYLGGGFTSLQPNGSGSSVARGYAAKINTDGTLDTNWNPYANSIVTSIGILANNEVIMAGSFGTLQPGGSSGTVVTRPFLAVVDNSSGSVDTNWYTIPNSNILSITVQADGYVLIGGSFTAIQVGSSGTPVTRNYVARLNGNAGSNFGQLDTTFDPDVNSTVNTVSLYAASGSANNNTVLIGGNFTQLQPGAAILVGGNFTTIAGQNIANLSRLSIDGAPDTTYTPNPNGAVNALIIQNDSKVVVGGNFTTIGTTSEKYLARLNTDGTVDTTYAPVLANSGSGTTGIYAAALQTDGKIVIGGNFTSVNGTAANHIARLTTSGALDTSFTGNANGTVYAIEQLPNGGLLVGGNFTSIGGGAAGYVAKLTTSGTIDSTFSANANGQVTSVAIEADGSIMVGGTFSSIGGYSRANFARLTSTGAIDVNFQADTNAAVNAIAIQQDGKPVFGGSFTTVAGLARNLFARVGASSQTTNTLGTTADEKTILWTRGGSSPELSAVFFDISPDGVTWSTIGAGTRVSGTANWTISIPTAPSTSTYYVRARGVSPNSQGASASLIEAEAEGVAGTDTTAH